MTKPLFRTIIPIESEVIEMIKCPNCGSTAQVKLQKIEDKEMNCYTTEVIRTYKCGCGQVFTAKEYKNNENGG